MARFKMIGRDENSSPTQYRTWVVEGQPDFTGQSYTGLKSGPNPLIDIRAYEILDDTAIVDFNYPAPLSWINTKRVLPELIYNSSFAILSDIHIDGYSDGYSIFIDGYDFDGYSYENDGYDGYADKPDDGYSRGLSAYLFGGVNTDKIFKAHLSNPADWVFSGARLPSVLSGSQLLVLNDTIYLFGGRDAYGAVDTIFTASVSNPLEWTNQGSLLPGKLYDSQLIILDRYLYLLGGHDGYNATRVIYQSSIADPLTWINTGSLLPDPLYASQAAVIGDKILLFGGLTTYDVPTNKIYMASTISPTFWNLYSLLPLPSSYAQFFSIGDQGYLIGPTSPLGVQPYLTRILRCNLSSPGQWVDTLRTVPGNISQSQVGIIYDRVFLFGGNGNTTIYANNPQLKFLPDVTGVAEVYGNKTRTQFQNAVTPSDLFAVLGFPYWKTDYKRQF